MTKTVEQIKASYAPYDKMVAFEIGYRDYSAGKAWADYRTGVEAQAYDRGCEAAMRVSRGK